MRRCLFFFLLFSHTFANAQVSVKISDSTSVVRTWHANGKMESEQFYKNELRDSTYREWSDSGILIKEFHYRKNVEHGPFRIWYANGQKEKDYTYSNGIRDGGYASWYPDGTLEDTEFFVNGKNEGLHEYWYSNKVKGAEENYRNGLRDGEVKKWNAQGVLTAEENYDMGMKTGRFTYWNDDGTVQMIENYSMDMLNGVSSYYIRDKRVAGISFRNDSLDGSFLLWWESTGTLRCNYNYCMNVRIGDFKRWDEKGRLVFHRKYRNGKPAGDKYPGELTVSSSCDDTNAVFSVCDSTFSMLKTELGPFFNFPYNTDSISRQILLPLAIVYNHHGMPEHLKLLMQASHAYVSISMLVPYTPFIGNGYSIFGSTLPHSETFYVYEDGEFDEIPTSDVMVHLCMNIFENK